MKETGKSVESDQDYTNFCPDYNLYYSSSSGVPCKKHPSSSPVGICAYCLKDRLMKLVCSDCGEQRLSSCSCSDVSSYRNSSCTVDVGSVGRISFLIENEKGGSGDEQQKTLFSHIKQIKKRETEDVILLKRSNSCVVEVKKSNGFWRIGKLFKKKREKEGCRERNRDGFDDKSEIWVSDCVMDVSRSRSLCSFRGGANFDHEGGSVSDMAYSSAKISDFNESEPRKSGFRGGLMDFESGFAAKESEFSRIHDDSRFIDLKLDLSDESKPEHPVFKNPPDGGGGGGGGGSSSCRITVNDRGIKKGSKGHSKVWKWIFKQHSGKKDMNHILES
ncbi:uncharacterized protein LOC112528408 [Cynara cardunculus var. scolymus]|uniref:Uncharacterized protein n=1 Tax=Cynara cardunculus var. scolymus TaxID=59895 RepID=A0A103XT03_CYNCS|nr:uncharacterized protein LOC112528408 [Cynara cardunculus var. scolymus]KVH96319.1 hypothetical protein Ccrd_001594 [Cynara cardunculus var. scolymus]